MILSFPSNLTAKAQSWSYYKHNSIKRLIGITPAQVIPDFVSWVLADGYQKSKLLNSQVSKNLWGLGGGSSRQVVSEQRQTCSLWSHPTNSLFQKLIDK